MNQDFKNCIIWLLTIITLLIPKITQYNNFSRYRDCEKMLNNKDFENSVYCFEKNGINKSEIKNKSVIRYKILYAQGLYSIKNYEKSKAELNKVIQYPKTSFSQKEKLITAIKEMEKIELALEKQKQKELERERLKKMDIGDYLSDIKKTSIWEHPSNIKFYFNLDDKRAHLIKEAFQKWDIACGSFINFEYTSDINNADIIVKSVPREEVRNCGEINNAVGCTIGASYHRSNKNYLKKATIKVTNDTDSDMYFTTLLHEIGHALGLHSHSPSKGDVMYNCANCSYTVNNLSNRDINTIKKLYGMI